MSCCQNCGPFVGPLNTGCCIMRRAQKRTIILTTTRMLRAKNVTKNYRPTGSEPPRRRLAGNAVWLRESEIHAEPEKQHPPTTINMCPMYGASSAAAKVRACHGFITCNGLHGQKTSRPNCAKPHAGPVRRLAPPPGATEVHEFLRLPRFLHLRMSFNRLHGQKPSGTPVVVVV